MKRTFSRYFAALGCAAGLLIWTGCPQKAEPVVNTTTTPSEDHDHDHEGHDHDHEGDDHAHDHDGERAAADATAEEPMEDGPLPAVDVPPETALEETIQEETEPTNPVPAPEKTEPGDPLPPAPAEGDAPEKTAAVAPAEAAAPAPAGEKHLTGARPTATWSTSRPACRSISNPVSRRERGRT
jgi:hypothetical protein